MIDWTNIVLSEADLAAAAREHELQERYKRRLLLEQVIADVLAAQHRSTEQQVAQMRAWLDTVTADDFK